MLFCRVQPVMSEKELLLSGKSFGLMVKCTPERGHNALFFIPLEVIIML